MMARTRLYGLAFVSAAVVAAALTASSLSQARVVPSATCSKIDSSFAWPQLNSSGYYTTDLGQSAIVCGYPDLSGDSKTSVTTVYVDINDNDPYGGPGAQVCSQPYGGGSIHCGSEIAEDAWGFTGNTSIALTGTDVTNAWGSSFAWDYGTVTVQLGNYTTVYGITTF